MNVKIKRVDSNFDLPKYQTLGSKGFDLTVRKTTTIKPLGYARIPMNVVIETPNDHMLIVSLRSSAPEKYGLSMPHGVGIIDGDYCGDGDEILLLVRNDKNTELEIEKGTRLGQGIFVKATQAAWVPVHSMNKEDRGGFGSTDEQK